MKKNAFLKGAFAVSVGGILAKILGAFYRIPLTNLLGGEGMGIYQMVYPFYCLLLTVSATGIPSALARVVAGAEAEGKDTAATLRRALELFAAIGVCGSVVMYLFAPVMSGIQREAGAVAAYRALAPSVALVSVISCFRGWFQGRGKFYPTAASEVIEQAAKTGFGLYFAYTFRENLYLAVAGCLLAVTIGEAVACAYMVMLAYTGRGRKPLYRDRSASSAAALLRVTVPVTVTAAILPFSNVIDSVLITRLLSRYAANATALYGLYSGAAASLAGLPASVCYGLAAASIPAVSAHYARGEVREGQKSILFSLKCTLFFAVPASAFLFAFAPQICAFVFPSVTGANAEMLAKLLRILAPSSLFLALTQTLSACLTATGKAKISALAMGAAVSVKLGLQAILLLSPKISVYGAAYACTACYFVALLVDLYYSITDGKFRVRALGYAAVVAAISVSAVAAAYLPIKIHVLAAAGAACGVYLALSALLGVFNVRKFRSLWRKKYDHGRRTWL